MTCQLYSSMLPGMDSTVANSDLQTDAWNGFQRMAVGMAARLNRRLVTESGISLPDYEVLSSLAGSETGTRRAFELGADLLWEKSRLSHHLKRMENRGLVARTVCESDGRGLWVSITGEGTRVHLEAARLHRDLVETLMVHRLDRDQLATLVAISGIVLEGMTDEICAT